MGWGLVRLKKHWNPSNWEGDSKIGDVGQTAKLPRLLRERTYKQGLNPGHGQGSRWLTVGDGKSSEEEKSRMRSQTYRKIIYLDTEVTKNYIRDRIDGKRVNQVLKILKG